MQRAALQAFRGHGCHHGGHRRVGHEDPEPRPHLLGPLPLRSISWCLELG